MSRSSFASFHLTGIKPSSGKMMTSSVDRLFENDSDVFISSNYNDFNQVSVPLSHVRNPLQAINSPNSTQFVQALPSIQEAASVQSKSPEPIAIQSLKSSSQSTIDQSSANVGGRESPSTATSTAKSSRRDSLTDKIVIPTQNQLQHQAAGQIHQQASIVNRSVAAEIPKNNTTNANRHIRFAAPNQKWERNQSIMLISFLTCFSSVAPINSTPAGGGELFEKFQRQKLNRESSVNSGASTDTWVHAT